jgi:hypothetical protein
VDIVERVAARSDRDGGRCEDGDGTDRCDRAAHVRAA